MPEPLPPVYVDELTHAIASGVLRAAAARGAAAPGAGTAAPGTPTGPLAGVAPGIFGQFVVVAGAVAGPPVTGVVGGGLLWQLLGGVAGPPTPPGP